MHPALLVDDIIHAILQNVTSSAEDMRNIAMTCSTLSVPALNMLWSEQSHLAPLIMCLPKHTWIVGESDYTIRSNLQNFSDTAPPLPMHWERARLNASRIRRLLPISDANWYSEYTSPMKPHISRRVLQQLFKLFPPAWLICRSCVQTSGCFANSFRPGLETLLFDVPPGVQERKVEQLFDALLAEAPGLQRLSISAARFTIPPSLVKLPKLKQLSIDGINVCLAMQNITNIQHSCRLDTLMLTLYGTSNDVDNPPSGDLPLELRTLKHLILAANNLPLCTSFLHQVTTPHLSSIHISYSTPARPTEITAFIESLSMSCQTFASLEKISMAGDSYQRPGPDCHSILPSHIFRPLLKFRRLSTVIFSDIGIYDLDDAFIDDVAVAWPNLCELEFASHRPGTSNDVTFAAMLSLASRCRSLRILHLTFDGTQLPTLPHTQDGNQELWPTQTALQELNVGHSRVSEEARVPYFLATVFPNLDVFTWHGMFGVSHGGTKALEEALEQLEDLRDTEGEDTDDFL
ncbi:hypothetical protein DEU56DRAFT_962076 [Suillus clintonianus]|uniref:uncharacterized protein n=1 Tax=Suillus clintonianus TaxID=1904413 RepID=UPI001B87BDEE|nr:uncharacterized protein DEU56DRAFT_962076 [Suillus clintonianus]KAG2125422.1 hypothetical protein DEU56DRAFT_962076 [Suillus clintonianus]